ncbi:hypothetical protein V5799_003995 [Amblyomma americanum]|uniref:Uncharacterized protein n=1 Tax=Amblyomma americanum TaxID=6943 RepID=A0AAQ4D7D4_AMBAM
MPCLQNLLSRTTHHRSRAVPLRTCTVYACVDCCFLLFLKCSCYVLFRVFTNLLIHDVSIGCVKRCVVSNRSDCGL